MDNQQNKDRNSAKELFQLGEMWRYVRSIFGKKDPNRPSSINLTLMHGINRITIVIFLLGVIYLIIKHLF